MAYREWLTELPGMMAWGVGYDRPRAEDRNQFALAVGDNFRRGSLPDEKGLLAIEPRHRPAAVRNILKKDNSKLSLKRKRLQAPVDPSFRTHWLTC